MAEKLTVNLTGNIVPEYNGDISILLIDHDAATSLSSMLKQRSYKVMSVNMVTEAVSIIEKQKDIGLVIANIEMPHIDSHYFLTAMLHKEIPLILFGQETNIKEASDVLTKRACFCLKKPISENDINNLWQHVKPNKSPELEKINIVEQREDIVDERMKEIEAFRENIKRQRSSQSSLLVKRPFIKTFTTSEMYQKRKGIANDEWKTKPMYHTEIENKKEEGQKTENNVEGRTNLWTRERHMKFLSAITILGEKDSHPKAILKIMNDSNLNHRQVASHLQKYKSQVERINNKLTGNEWKSTTSEYPSNYECPFKLSNIQNNLIESYSLWYSLRKKKSSSSSNVQYSFKKPAAEKKAKMLKFHLGGKLDLSQHSLSGNISNVSSMQVNYVPSPTNNNPSYNIPSTNDFNNSGLSNDNHHVLSGFPLSSVGASSLDAFQKESADICLSQSNPNSSQISSFVETDKNPLDIGPIFIPDSSVAQTNLCTIGETSFQPDANMTPLETNMNHVGRVPSAENYSHHETNMNPVDWIPTTEDHVLPETDMNMILPEANTNHMGWVSSEESYVISGNKISSETNMSQMGRGSLAEHCGLSQDRVSHETKSNHLGFVSGETSHEIPPETSTNQMDWDWFLSEENYARFEDTTTNTTQEGLVPGETSYAALENVVPLENNTDEMGLVLGETSYAALENVVPLENNTDEMGLVPGETSYAALENVVPLEVCNDIPIEDLISFDTDVNEMDFDSSLENYDSSQRDIPSSTSNIGHDLAFTSMDSISQVSMEDNDHSFAMHLESTSQQHNRMGSCGYQAENARETMEGINHFDDDSDQNMNWVDNILDKNT